MNTRREFLKAVGVAGLGAALAGSYPRFVFAAQCPESLIDAVKAVCRRLGAAGWRDMLLDVSGGMFDLFAPNLSQELGKVLPQIDRSFPGFGDFSVSGNRAIQPGWPDYSLLYHALAAPSVTTGRNGLPLTAFPTLAEIDIVENYIYASRMSSLSTVLSGFESLPAAIVMFATHYRNAPMAVSGKHAQLCFSRCGIGRIGNMEPRYDARLRSFVSRDETTPVFDFNVVPRRFSPYLAVQMTMDGRLPEQFQFGPQDALDSDRRNQRQFWVPVHKLFSGRECLPGLNLNIALSRGMVNDEVASFHRFLDAEKLLNNWAGGNLEEYPFTIKDEKIASLSLDPAFGPGVMVPRANAMVEEARYQGARLTFPVDPRYSGQRANLQMSSLFILPGSEPPISPQYLDDAGQDIARPAPEYINIRHRVVNGEVDNLNNYPDMEQIIAQGEYQAQHYIDFSGDGWVIASCPELLQMGVSVSKPAFCMIGLPDFLPKMSQRELMLWWNNEVPEALRDTLWAVPPFALSQTRMAANIELPVGFSIDDDTVTAIVSQAQVVDGTSVPIQIPNGPLYFDKVGMPDGSPGLFDPGWDSSMGIEVGKDGTLKRFLIGHGLGSPFIEDAKLCAALGSYWPGVAPDSTRQYQPDKILSGISYPWPTIVPFTDEELGMQPVSDGPLKGKSLSWDGIPGPHRTVFQGREVIEYVEESRVDYIDIQGTMTAALTSRIDSGEYKSRILSMAAIYWSLGVRGNPGLQGDVNKVLREKSAWAVLSFRAVPVNEPELVSIATQLGATLAPQRHYYRFEVYRWGGRHTDPAKLRSVWVDIQEEAIAYTDGRQVFINRGPVGSWKLDTTIPI